MRVFHDTFQAKILMRMSNLTFSLEFLITVDQHNYYARPCYLKDKMRPSSGTIFKNTFLKEHLSFFPFTEESFDKRMTFPAVNGHL